MFKAIIGIVLGIVLAGCLVALNEALVHRLAGGPGLKPGASAEEIAAMIAAVPIGAKLAVTAGWVFATFVASGFAGWFAERGCWPAYSAGAGFYLLVAMNLLMLPHPDWMVWSATVGCFLASYLGGRLLSRWPKANAGQATGGQDSGS